MFERRLKILLAVLLVFTLALIARALQIQVIDREYWVNEAGKAMRRSHLIDTTRGTIYDHRGKAVAIDQACIDACVAYPAIAPEPDPKWVKDTARARLVRRLGEGYTGKPLSERQTMLDAEVEAVKTDLQI